jgi:hypothetical protein
MNSFSFEFSLGVEEMVGVEEVEETGKGGVAGGEISTPLLQRWLARVLVFGFYRKTLKGTWLTR